MSLHFQAYFGEYLWYSRWFKHKAGKSLLWQWVQCRPNNVTVCMYSSKSISRAMTCLRYDREELVMLILHMLGAEGHRPVSWPVGECLLHKHLLESNERLRKSIMDRVTCIRSWIFSLSGSFNYWSEPSTLRYTINFQYYCMGASLASQNKI